MERKFEAFTLVSEWEKKGKTTDAGSAEALIKNVELLLPCILHCENRVGEKIVMTIISKGFELNGESVMQFVKEVQHII